MNFDGMGHNHRQVGVAGVGRIKYWKKNRELGLKMTISTQKKYGENEKIKTSFLELKNVKNDECCNF